jgi:putative SOS response-associated peptidase YedK
MTSRSPIPVRSCVLRGHADEVELVQRRWSWPGSDKWPVYNFRSEGREFTSNRCLIISDGFYEFTDSKDSTKTRKDKWLFTKPGETFSAFAGVWRSHPEIGEAFTMLTMGPGPDVVPYHDRRIVILERDTWADWLDPSVSAQSLIRQIPAGTLSVEQVG